MTLDDCRPFLPVAGRALELVEPGQTIGLGSGRASMAFLLALGERVRQGLRVQGVATSEAIAAQARREGIPVLELAGSRVLDQAFDGADEVDPQLNLIKGLGGALLREKGGAWGWDRRFPWRGSRGMSRTKATIFWIARFRLWTIPPRSIARSTRFPEW